MKVHVGALLCLLKIFYTSFANNYPPPLHPALLSDTVDTKCVRPPASSPGSWSHDPRTVSPGPPLGSGGTP